MTRSKQYRWRLTTIATTGVFFCLVAGTAQGGKATTLKNIERTPHFAPTNSSPASLVRAIEHAGKLVGWSVEEENEQGVLLSTVVRMKHQATVFVGFDETYFWVDYVDSMNLNYSRNDRKINRGGHRKETVKGPVIHPNYNIWVATLAEEIRQSMRFPPAATESQAASNQSGHLVADELEKLDALRQKGILTDEEFDLLKAKILDP
jgi:hypothetical protein